MTATVGMRAAAAAAVEAAAAVAAAVAMGGVAAVRAGVQGHPPSGACRGGCIALSRDHRMVPNSVPDGPLWTTALEYQERFHLSRLLSGDLEVRHGRDSAGRIPRPPGPCCRRRRNAAI